MSKHDQRGHHWKAKVESGQAPTPWKGQQEWVNKRKQMEEEFKKAAREYSQSDEFPWAGSKTPPGNTTRTLWMYLKMCQWAGILSLEDAPDKGLCGITKVTIHDLDEFNEGPFPILDYKADVGPEETKRRLTVLKQWRVAGFVKLSDESECTMQFETEVRDKLRAASTRKRQAQKDTKETHKQAKTTVPTATVISPSYTVHFPVLIARVADENDVPLMGN